MAEPKSYPMIRDKYIVRGDDGKFSIVFHNNLTPLDITNYDFWCRAKNHEGDTDADAVISIDPSDVVKADSGTGTTDTAILPITSAKSDVPEREYPFGIRWQDDAGNIKTIWKGNLIVEPARTETTP